MDVFLKKIIIIRDINIFLLRNNSSLVLFLMYTKG